MSYLTLGNCVSSAGCSSPRLRPGAGSLLHAGAALLADTSRWALRRRDARQQSKSFKRAWTRNYHLSTSNYFTSAHVDGRRLNPMINQRSANVAGTAIKAMTTRTETADANG
jgi:hypothetical protein